MPTPEGLFGAIVFGAFGMGFFAYGKRKGSLMPMLFGVALMGFPYFVSDGWPLFATGIALTTGAFYFRE